MWQKKYLEATNCASIPTLDAPGEDYDKCMWLDEIQFSLFI